MVSRAYWETTLTVFYPVDPLSSDEKFLANCVITLVYLPHTVVTHSDISFQNSSVTTALPSSSLLFSVTFQQTKPTSRGGSSDPGDTFSFQILMATPHNFTPNYKDFLRWYQNYHNLDYTTSVAHTGNSSVCLSQSSSIGSWVLDSGASDHVAGNKNLFSSLSASGFFTYYNLCQWFSNPIQRDWYCSNSTFSLCYFCPQCT